MSPEARARLWAVIENPTTSETWERAHGLVLTRVTPWNAVACVVRSRLGRAGTGGICVACELPIAPDDVEVECDLPNGGTIRLHRGVLRHPSGHLRGGMTCAPAA